MSPEEYYKIFGEYPHGYPSARPSYPNKFTELLATNPVTKFLVPGAERFLQRGQEPGLLDYGLAVPDVLTPGLPLTGLLGGIVRRKTSTGLGHLGYKDWPDTVPNVTRWVQEEGLSDEPLKKGATRFFKEKKWEGTPGKSDHLTMIQEGFVDPQLLKTVPGRSGEIRGARRNMDDKRWEGFKKDIEEHGIEEPILVIKDADGTVAISEGNHRLDAALELGLDRVPVDFRYFGKSESLGQIISKVDDELVLGAGATQKEIFQITWTNAKGKRQRNWVKRLSENSFQVLRKDGSPRERLLKGNIDYTIIMPDKGFRLKPAAMNNTYAELELVN